MGVHVPAVSAVGAIVSAQVTNVLCKVAVVGVGVGGGT
jgi:hypothetical protein